MTFKGKKNEKFTKDWFLLLLTIIYWLAYTRLYQSVEIINGITKQRFLQNCSLLSSISSFACFSTLCNCVRTQNAVTTHKYYPIFVLQHYIKVPANVFFYKQLFKRVAIMNNIKYIWNWRESHVKFCSSLVHRLSYRACNASPHPLAV